MLILTRREGEVIKIGNDIEISVCKVDGFQVKIGIQAPKDVQILRKEIASRYEQKESKKDINEVTTTFKKKWSFIPE